MLYAPLTYNHIILLTIPASSVYQPIYFFFPYRCHPSSMLRPPCGGERWEEVRYSVPVSGSALPLHQCFHSVRYGEVDLQVVLPGPHEGLIQLPRQLERRPGRRRAAEWKQRGRRRLRGGLRCEPSRLLRQQEDRQDRGLHIRVLGHALRVLQEQRCYHHQQ